MVKTIIELLHANSSIQVDEQKILNVVFVNQVGIIEVETRVFALRISNFYVMWQCHF